MNKFKIKINYETEIEAIDEDDALNKMLAEIESEPQQDFRLFVANNMKAKKITIKHDYKCNVCGKPATYNLQGDGWTLWDITPDGEFEKNKEWGLGESGNNEFLCDECYENI